MRARVVPLALSLGLAGCIHPAVSRFNADYGCTSGEARDLGDGVIRVEGCGIDATYVCAEQRGGTTICVPQSRDRGPASEGPTGPVHENRLALEEPDGAARLAVAVEGTPALVYDPARAPARVLVDAEACAAAALRGVSGAAAQAAEADDALGFELRDFVRFASEDALTLTLCGAEVALRGTEMQTFRAFVARAGALRPVGAPPPAPEDATDGATEPDGDPGDTATDAAPDGAP